MEPVVFKMESENIKALKKEISKNRRWNTQSDLIRTIVKLYLTDNSVRSLVYRKIAERVNETWLDGNID